jgi:hypothetical protein
MKLMMSLIILLNFQVAFAWTVNTEVEISAKGGFQDQVTLSCRPGEPLCSTICGNADSCAKEQELCYNCLGTSSPLLRTVFTEIDRLYQNSSRVLSGSEVAQVFSKDHVFVAAKSIYNFYSAIDDAAVLARFQSLCPNASPAPLIVLSKNRNNEPNHIQYVVCEGVSAYDQNMYVLEYNPQVETPAGIQLRNN